VGLDQDDSATGTHVDAPGLTVPQGPASSRSLRQHPLIRLPLEPTSMVYR
jgi:hypothetical protein